MAAATGTEYVALANLSVPRAGRKAEDPNDLVPQYGTVILTDEQAAPFLHRRPPVIARKADFTAGAVPRLMPKHLSGSMFRPSVPPPDTDMPRPDPEGSSHLVVFDDPRIPELREPVPDSETRPPGIQAEDIPPTGAGQQAAQALAARAGRSTRRT